MFSYQVHGIWKGQSAFFILAERLSFSVLLLEAISDNDMKYSDMINATFKETQEKGGFAYGKRAKKVFSYDSNKR